MTKSKSQIRSREPNLIAPLLLRGISAGFVWMVALLTVGGTMDTLAADDVATSGLLPSEFA